MKKWFKCIILASVTLLIIYFIAKYIQQWRWESDVKAKYHLTTLDPRCKFDFEHLPLRHMDYGTAHYFSSSQKKCIAGNPAMRVEFDSPFTSYAQCQQICENKQ